MIHHEWNWEAAREKLIGANIGRSKNGVGWDDAGIPVLQSQHLGLNGKVLNIENHRRWNAIFYEVEQTLRNWRASWLVWIVCQTECPTSMSVVPHECHWTPLSIDNETIFRGQARNSPGPWVLTWPFSSQLHCFIYACLICPLLLISICPRSCLEISCDDIVVDYLGTTSSSDRDDRCIRQNRSCWTRGIKLYGSRSKCRKYMAVDLHFSTLHTFTIYSRVCAYYLLKIDLDNLYSPYWIPPLILPERNYFRNCIQSPSWWLPPWKQLWKKRFRSG